MDMLERRGFNSGDRGSSPGQVLTTMADLPRVLADGGDPPPPRGTGDTLEAEPVDAEPVG